MDRRLDLKVTPYWGDNIFIIYSDGCYFSEKIYILKFEKCNIN